MCGKPARTVYEGDPASEEPRRNALLHKRNIKRLFLGIAAGFFAVLALLCVRYGGTAKRILSSGYIVETHKDHFNFFGFPGSGGDMQGFCKVIPPNNSLKAAYFYLEMTQFVSEINDATIKFQGDAFLENRPETPQAIAKVRQPRKNWGNLQI